MILKTTGLCKNFKGQIAVNNVALNIQKNSVYGLLGPNGAGKSTTLKMITGILKPTSGSIEFDGHPWQRSDLKQIGIETPPLYENLTAYENLKVRTTMLGLPDKRIDEAEQMQKEQIAVLAHDLKTPLTVIQGNADLIAETELDEEQRLYAEYISSSSEQMQLYIRTLIDISRAASGYQLHMEDIDLPAFAEQLRGQIDALCQTKK